ncbi:hypothetical protein AVEN_101028-1 [Araneus ventricosus]|uniref:Peptidase aspartic putative domain-containing protein n=1 Tax=Araneus ventricosus TaxID=182803 RepID=A0A4Y2KD65_ARAVE|nr:hypothetical protein AVEN_101028-1 [Araneus ventricosus]
MDEFDIQSIWNKSKIPILAYNSDNKYTLYPSALIDISIFTRDKNLKLAYPVDDCYHLIELLICSDLYWTIVLAEAPKYISPSSTLYISKIGWIISGNRSNVNVKKNSPAEQCAFSGHISIKDSNTQLNNQFKQFWELK